MRGTGWISPRGWRITLGATPDVEEDKMSGRIEARLAELGIVLPEPKPPVANYVPYVVTGTTLFVSGQVSVGPEGPITGRLEAGAGEAEIARAQDAARHCGLFLIAQAKAAAGDLDRIARVVKLTGFVASAPGFAQQPAVVNGCSDLMVEVFGDAGRHSRSAVGVAALPLDVTVEIEGIFELA